MIHVKDTAQCLPSRKISISLTSYFLLGLSLNVISSEKSCLSQILPSYSPRLRSCFTKVFAFVLYVSNNLCVCLFIVSCPHCTVNSMRARTQPTISPNSQCVAQYQEHSRHSPNILLKISEWLKLWFRTKFVNPQCLLGNRWHLRGPELSQKPVEFHHTTFQYIILTLYFKMLTHQNQITGPNSKLTFVCQD